MLFLAGMIVVFPLAILASFFGRPKSGDIIYKLCTRWTDFVLRMCGIFHHNINDNSGDENQQFVFVFNHISYLDIPILLKSLRRNRIRVLGRADLARIPIFGFMYRNTAILVDRADKDDRAKSVQNLKNVIEQGISIVIAPEGTFNETNLPLKECYDGAFRIAIETQTPIKPILFLDTNDRYNNKSIFSLTPGKSRTVFLPKVSVVGLSLQDLPMLKQKVIEMMEEKLIYYKVSWIKQ